MSNDIQPEILERLQGLEPLTCKTKLYSCPVQYREGFEQHYDEFARITRRWPSNWRYGKIANFAVDADRCQRTGATICLHVSPQVPFDDDWEKARDDYADRWQYVASKLPLALVEVVYLDLEGFPYAPPGELTDATVRHNDAVRYYNREVYRIAKDFVGDSIEVRRYAHLAIGQSTDPAFGTTRVSRNTCWADPVDGGWGVSWYRPMYWPQGLENLEETIQEGRQHGIQEGTVWVTAGCSSIDWQCPGIDCPYETVTGQIVAWPYDPAISHKIGSLFGHPYWRKKIHGDDYRNDTRPPLGKVHSVCLWPGIFHNRMDKTAAHLLAVLEGMSAKAFDPKLREIQAGAFQ